MKKIIAIAMALSMLLVMIPGASAAEASFETSTTEVNYMEYDFPDDAVVLYQGEDGVIYQSKEESNNIGSTRAMVYESVWIDAGKHGSGTFSIENPHTLVLSTNGTFKIESEYDNARAQMILHDGIFTYANETFRACDGDIHIEFTSHTKDLVISYLVYDISNTEGMRLMCWLW